MREITGDIWDCYDEGYWITITTNGTVRKDGACVLGRGIALQAKNRFPSLPFRLGIEINLHGNQVFFFPEFRLVTFPVKHNWWEEADIGLIENSAIHFAGLVEFGYLRPPVYLVRPGCGNGGLNWKDVKPILEKYLDYRFMVVERKGKDGEL